MSSRRGKKISAADRAKAREAARTKIQALKSDSPEIQAVVQVQSAPVDLFAEARYAQYAEKLKKVALLSPLSDNERMALARKLSTVEFEGGQDIITKGQVVDADDGMYMMQSGNAQVHT